MMCRVRRTSEWTYRLLLESYYWEHTSFYTLTYDDTHIPIMKDEKIFKDEEGKVSYWQKEGCALTLYPKDTQDFFKRLRKKQSNIKYYICGEYGDETGRPHYHTILFGIRPRTDEEMIEEIWQNGRVQGKPFLRQRAQYTAGYIQKKLYGPQAEYIQSILNEKGATINRIKVTGVIPPFSRMSKGIGLKYALEMKEQIKEDLNIRIKGQDIGLPRYFIKKLELENECKLKNLKRTEKVIGKEKLMKLMTNNIKIIDEIAESDLKKAKHQEANRRALHRIYGNEGRG